MVKLKGRNSFLSRSFVPYASRIGTPNLTGESFNLLPDHLIRIRMNPTGSPRVQRLDLNILPLLPSKL